MSNNQNIIDSNLEDSITYEMPDSPEEFLSQVVDAYPEGDFQSLRKIIGIGKVRYQSELAQGVPMTAAVVNTKPYTLLFGKEFLEKKMRTTEDCVYILSHELTHLVLDHFAKDILSEFKEKQIGAKASHIIVDCQVNATCYNSLIEEKYLEFIKRFYPETEMPYCFFRPDGKPLYNTSWEPVLDADGNPIIENGQQKLEKILIPLEEEVKQKLSILHEKLFSKGGITNKELIDGLMDWFKEQQNKLDEVIKNLLGNHKDLLRDKTGDQNSEELDDLIESVGSDLTDSLKKEKNKESEQTKRGCSTEGNPREMFIKTCLDKISYVKNIKRQLKRVEVVSPSSKIYKAIEAFFPKKQTRTVVPNFYDRRTSALYSRGTLPIFHMNKQIGSKIMVPCYLDVSGSQDHVIPYILPVVSRLKQKIGNVVYCFSTYISETPIQNLEKGKISTSGSTDFNPIVEHLLKHSFKNVLILTDGCAGLSSDLKEKVLRRKINITVGWTVPDPSFSPLQEIANNTFYVFEGGS